MLHVWLKRLNEGNTEMDWVDIPGEALYREDRIKWMDANQVEACSLFPRSGRCLLPCRRQGRPAGPDHLVQSLEQRRMGLQLPEPDFLSTAMLSFEDEIGQEGNQLPAQEMAYAPPFPSRPVSEPLTGRSRISMTCGHH